MRHTYRYDSIDPGVGASRIAETEEATVVQKQPAKCAESVDVIALDRAQTAAR